MTTAPLLFALDQISTLYSIAKHMDTDAIGDPINKLKAMRMDDDEYEDEEDDLDDYDDEDLEPVTLGFVDKPKHHWSLSRQYFPSKAGGVPVLNLHFCISLFNKSKFQFLMVI